MNKAFVCILTLPALLVSAGAMTLSFAGEQRARQQTNSDPWYELMQRTPYPYTLPIPADIPTAVDGKYVKFETKKTPPIPCRRCPDYKPEGGWWKVSLRRGIFRIYHPVSGWKSLGTFTVSGNRIRLANDPVCPELTGDYRWERNQGKIRFYTIEDRCSAGLRAKNFTHLPWQFCHPPSTETADNDRWAKPQGCDQQ